MQLRIKQLFLSPSKLLLRRRKLSEENFSWEYQHVRPVVASMKQVYSVESLVWSTRTSKSTSISDLLSLKSTSNGMREIGRAFCSVMRLISFLGSTARYGFSRQRTLRLSPCTWLKETLSREALNLGLLLGQMSWLYCGVRLGNE